MFPSYFYCVRCNDWTDVEDFGDEISEDFACSECGESYQCGECGYEINRRGECERPGDSDGGTSKGCFYSKHSKK